MGLLRKNKNKQQQHHAITAAAQKPLQRSVTPATDDSSHSVDTAVQSFAVLKSHVVDQATGQVCVCDKVYRGTTRLETLTFQIPTGGVQNLTRHVVTSKKLGFAYMTVNHDTLVLGSFVTAGPNQCDLPPNVVPSTAMAKGTYRIHITYTAENIEGLLREETVEFCIV
eukprot:CAMPEP_0172451886 /NCGR_PEP_ID=MMETSP1065-20121228/9725_1 /TAXON_ID=265537 /ORGANISM="Amphiprora paludosa, Strain CCMP125" /LENGTH=167 /DNA_ID=CAMNT_0013203857 /DNA_START=74 /DNA_END=577 /DNA_ORIENTATION=-